MVGEWRQITLGDVMSFANGKTSPERSDGMRHPVYGSNGVIGFADETNSPENTIVIGRVGSYCGSLYLSKQKCWVTDNAIRASALDDNDGRFLFYLLSSLDLNHWRSGSGQPLLNQTILSQIPASAPPADEQRAIAQILCTLDDKIELNRKMNETLEAMARTIFKSWFVDFDPIPGLGPHKEWQDSPFGRIPKGWKVTSIGEAVRVVGGSTPSTKEPVYWERGTINWATPKDLASLSSPVLLDTERRITEKGLEQISSGLLPKGTVLLSSRAPIGYLAIAEIPVAINQGFIAMICEQELPNHYILQWTKANMDIIEGRANGTTFLEVSKTNFRPIPIVIPYRNILHLFQLHAEAIHKQIATNLNQALSLATIRNVLLPELLSGEIRVKDAERFVEIGL